MPGAILCDICTSQKIKKKNKQDQNRKWWYKEEHPTCSYTNGDLIPSVITFLCILFNKSTWTACSTIITLDNFKLIILSLQHKFGVYPDCLSKLLLIIEYSHHCFIRVVLFSKINLLLPKQCCQGVIKVMRGWFLVNISVGKCKPQWSPMAVLYNQTVW